VALVLAALFERLSAEAERLALVAQKRTIDLLAEQREISQHRAGCAPDPADRRAPAVLAA
jgi:hypothetical protein